VPVVAETQKPDSKLVLLKTSRMPVWLSKPLHSLPLEFPLLNVIPLSLGLVTHAVLVISIAMAFKNSKKECHMNRIRIGNGKFFILLALSLFVFGGCGTNNTSPTTTNTSPGVSSTPTPATTQRVRISKACSLPPAAPSPDSNPQAGDIPDTQVFVTYASSSGGYQLEVPEGWGRSTNGTEVSFVGKLDGVRISLAQASLVPTANSVSTNQAVTLEQSGQAVRDVCVQDVQLHGKPAVLMVYTSNSDPDPVTGKQVRLENNAYLFFKNGKLATLWLWAPLGADNVDQWKLISRSFRWV